MNYNEYMANIKAYRNGTLMQAAPTDALSDWHEKYFDTAVSALSKKMIADHVEHSEDADKFGKDFVSLVAILEEDGVSKQDIGKELVAVSKAAQSQADAAIKKLDSVQHGTDTLEGYKAAIKAYKENHLEHAEWKKHKYIRIENGRYIYPDDLKKNNNTSSRNNQVPLNKQISNKITSTLSNLTPKKTTTAPTSPASRDQVSGEKYVKNKLNEIATGFKNIGSAVKEHRGEKAEGPKVEEYVKLANGQTVSKKEYEDEFRKNIEETDRRYHEQKQKKAENEARDAGRKATQEYKESGQHEKDVADEKAKKEQQARQDEAKKIASMTPDEARKRAAELTKQNTPEKAASSNPKVNDAYKEFRKYIPDSAKEWNDEFKKLDEFLKEKNLSDSEKKELEKLITKDRVKAADSFAPMPGAKSTYGDMSDQKKENKQEEVDRYKPIKPENMSKEQLDAFKEMSREYMDSMEQSAKKYQQDNQRPTKVVVTKTDPYTGAPTAAKVTYIDNNGHEQDTGYFFKDLSEDATLDNLERRIDSKKKVQHSDPRAAFYAAVDEYKSKKGLNQQVPL